MSNALSLRTPQYRRHKAHGLAVVTITGRDIYLGKYGSAASKEVYRRLVAEYLLSGHVNEVATPAPITAVEVLAAYLRHAKQYYRKNGAHARVRSDPGMLPAAQTI